MSEAEPVSQAPRATRSVQHADSAVCPIRDVLHRIGDKWSILVILHLQAEPRRFGELRRRIPDISQRMLTQSLRNLQREGLLGRQVFPTNPPSVEYRLTDLGHSLLQPIGELARWAEAHHGTIRESRTRFDAERMEREGRD